MATSSTSAASASPQPSALRRRVRRIAVFAALIFMLGVVATEVVLRVVMGLGDPPLFDRDPAIEYLYKPSRAYRYLNHTVEINSHAMRSPEFPAAKSDPRELRVMVIGDSIITGGARIDQSELATAILAEQLRERLGRPVTVGNIACGSWGPPNQLAFVRRFGLFDADVVLIVTNSGDADDVPGLEPIGGAWPTSRPPLAILEVGRRALERAAPGVASRLGLLERASPPAAGERARLATAALSDLVAEARARGAAVGVVQYLKLDELKGTPDAGHAPLRAAAEAAGARVWSTADGEGAFTAEESLFLPGDAVHPSAAGQRRLAERLSACAVQLLEAPARPESEKAPSRP